jgi:putative oxidoreductase
MLTKILSTQSERAYALLRIVSGLALSFHGMQKMFGLLSSQPRPPFGTQMWFGGVIELVCGLAMALGFFTSWAAFLASGTMAVAYIQFHWKFQFNQAFFPVINGGELALIYCFLFLFIACKGGGVWSLDHRRRVKNERASS